MIVYGLNPVLEALRAGGVRAQHAVQRSLARPEGVGALELVDVRRQRVGVDVLRKVLARVEHARQHPLRVPAYP